MSNPFHPGPRNLRKKEVLKVKGEFSEVVCLFCQRKLETPADYQQTYNCVCGAKYTVYSEDDLCLAVSEACEVFGLHGVYVETRIHKGFDILTDSESQDPATGDRQALVFFRPKDQWAELHQLALARLPQCSQHQRNCFARAVMALIGAVKLGQAGGGPTSREHAALGLHGQGGRPTFESAVELLIAEDGPIFGPISDIHRQCWVEEFCFGDDPGDVAELKRST